METFTGNCCAASSSSVVGGQKALYTRIEWKKLTVEDGAKSATADSMDRISPNEDL